MSEELKPDPMRRIRSYVADLLADSEEMYQSWLAEHDPDSPYRRPPAPVPRAVSEEAVGIAVAMPGSNGGFTMAIFNYPRVPVGTKLYASPQSGGSEGSAAELATSPLSNVTRPDATGVTAAPGAAGGEAPTPAASASQQEEGWRDIASHPLPEDAPVLLALRVVSAKDKSFLHWDVWADHTSNNPEHENANIGWRIADAEFWQPLRFPASPAKETDDTVGER